jgi:hypothetical protein
MGQRVETQCSKSRLDEAQTFYNLDGDAFQAGTSSDFRAGSFRHIRVTWDGIDHSLRAPAKLQNVINNMRIDIIEGRELIVESVK